MMRGKCEICDQISEVFQSAGRSDLLCSDCYVNVGAVIQLYEILTEVERAGLSALELETQIKHALRGLFSRFESRANKSEMSAGLFGPATLTVH
jgi:hypothetical protein